MSMNPYDFIPLEEVSKRTFPPGQHLLPRNAGVIHAELETQTPFLIARQQPGGNGIVPLRNGEIIPGSSIKGMIRSLAEIVGGGCISLSSSLYFKGKYSYNHAREPKDFAPCNDIKKLCVTCRMFGFLERSNVWKGLVAPGEGKWLGDSRPKTQKFNVIVGTPKPDHYSFYTIDNTVRGRKTYYHANSITVSNAAHNAAYGARQTINVTAIGAGEKYQFSIYHQGLDKFEYSLLLYAVFLEENMAHKLGWGKPRGFGTVKITPITIEEIDLYSRYRMGSSKPKLYKSENAISRVKELTTNYRKKNNSTITALRKMLTFDPNRNKETDLQYPDYQWFKQNPEKSLEEYNRE